MRRLVLVVATVLDRGSDDATHEDEQHGSKEHADELALGAGHGASSPSRLRTFWDGAPGKGAGLLGF
jgi:hypothetical protein